MVRPEQEATETFMSITGLSEEIAMRKLLEHGCNIDDAVDAHFNEGDRNLAASSLDFKDADENHDASSLPDLTVDENISYSPSDPPKLSLFVTQPREVRETPICGSARPVAPSFEILPDGSDEIEEQIMRAAIEASKREFEKDLRRLEDADIDHAIFLSRKSAEQETAQRMQGDVRAPIVGPPKSSEEELVKASNGRLQAVSSFFQDEAEDAEEHPLIRNRSRPLSLGSTESAKNANVTEISTLSSSGNQDSRNNPQHKRNAIHEEEWAGVSSVELDEGVMLEAAMFGGIPNDFMQNRVSYWQPAPRPPSLAARRLIREPRPPSLTAQRLTRERQDDEYLASLQADKEKKPRAVEEEKAACEEERRREEELERQLAAKEAALPPEPSSDDENAVTLQVRMPNGSRRGRRFLRSDNLESVFNFIDIGRVVKPGTYRLVRTYPRRVCSDGEGASTLNEVGITSKQEALFLELISDVLIPDF